MNVSSLVSLYFLKVFVILMSDREEFINKDIERAVASMQAVIELGRVVRERNTLPLKVMK